LPLTVHGKVDKEKLPDIEDTTEEESDRHVAPRNVIEKKLVHIWKEVLGLDNEISVIDNFFKLGGHSIRAIKMLSGVTKEFGVVINVQKLFEEPTIEELAVKIMNAGWHADGRRVNKEEYESIKI
jgi:acyl carrier protein